MGFSMLSFSPHLWGRKPSYPGAENYMRSNSLSLSDVSIAASDFITISCQVSSEIVLTHFHISWIIGTTYSEFLFYLSCFNFELFWFYMSFITFFLWKQALWWGCLPSEHKAFDCFHAFICHFPFFVFIFPFLYCWCCWRLNTKLMPSVVVLSKGLGSVFLLKVIFGWRCVILDNDILISRKSSPPVWNLQWMTFVYSLVIGQCLHHPEKCGAFI